MNNDRVVKLRHIGVRSTNTTPGRESRAPSFAQPKEYNSRGYGIYSIRPARTIAINVPGISSALSRSLKRVLDRCIVQYLYKYRESSFADPYLQKFLQTKICSFPVIVNFEVLDILYKYFYFVELAYCTGSPSTLLRY
jgi:hypothetical protein